jgi:hypothetical protein
MWKMKRGLRRGLLAVLAIVGTRMEPASAVLVAYDDFNYTSPGSDLTGNGGNGSFGFSTPWTGQTSYNVGAGSLASPRDALPMVGNSVTAVAFGENRDIDRTLATPLGVEGTSVYISLLMRPQGILGQGAYGGWFALALRGSPDIFIGMIYGGTKYGIDMDTGPSSLSSQSAVIDRTEFLVFRVDFTEGVDPMRLYVNPQPGAAEPSAASASLINYDLNGVTSFSLTGPGAAAFDAIRVGTTFLDVAPPTSDFDNSGTVDSADLAIWTPSFGSTTATHGAGDTNSDGDVDGNDFLVWQRQVGSTYTVPPVALAVPEPTLGPALLAISTITARRRRLASQFR